MLCRPACQTGGRDILTLGPFPHPLSPLWALATRFYDEQNEHIRALLKPLSKHAEEAQDAEDSSRLPVKIAVWASLAANCCLAVLQLYAAASSLSLSFFGAPHRY